MTENEFDISVIMPVYNTEKFLREAIDSIVNQSIGFREHIQLILVDDGSTDRSGEICKSYQERFPSNIVYVYKQNGGVSSACNLGLKYAKGELINFFGSDDIWERQSFEDAWGFYQKHKDEVDVITCQVRYFGSQKGEHPLNYRCKEEAVVDLNEHPDFSQCADGNCFFRRTAIADRRFDEVLHNAEDALFLNDILLDKCQIGIICKARYMYRRRKGSSAAINSKKNRFVIEPERFCKKLFELSRERYGYVQPFIRCVMMYELQWRLLEKPTEDITNEEIEVYEKTIKELLSEIDDDFIINQRKMQNIKIAFAFRLKYGDDFYRTDIIWKNRRAYKGNQHVYTINRRKCFRFDTCEVENNRLRIHGTTDITSLGCDFRVFARDEVGKEYPAIIKDFPLRDVFGFNKKCVVDSKEIVFSLPLNNKKRYKFFVQIGNSEAMVFYPFFGYLAKFDHRNRHSYFVTEEYIIKYERNTIKVFRYSKKTHIASEARFVKYILQNKNKNKDRLRFVLYRELHNLYRLIIGKREVWLISDRNMYATDNGAALFEHIADNKLQGKPIIYFVLDKKSRDYPRLKQFGKIVSPKSLKYKILFLLSNKIISAHADLPVIQPFTGSVHYIIGLVKFQYVYLQHGILQGNLESWLNKHQKNIKLLVTSTKMETNAILNGQYGYSVDEVQLLGMPRFDSFKKYDVIKKIVFLPTWRADIAGKIDGITRTRMYVEDFSETEYCKFYNSLINNHRLIHGLKKNNYYGEFYLHPNFIKQKDDFHGNDIIVVKEEEAQYDKLLGEAALLITDYSGVQFDFAYQRKPIVYSQFDNIYSGEGHHSYSNSYFSYETQGFGPICYTAEEVVTQILAIVDNDCKLSDEYKQRVDEFFFYDDYNNSDRVLTAIQQL